MPSCRSQAKREAHQWGGAHEGPSGWSGHRGEAEGLFLHPGDGMDELSLDGHFAS